MYLKNRGQNSWDHFRALFGNVNSFIFVLCIQFSFRSKPRTQHAGSVCQCCIWVRAHIPARTESDYTYQVYNTFNSLISGMAFTKMDNKSSRQKSTFYHPLRPVPLDRQLFYLWISLRVKNDRDSTRNTCRERR